MDGAHCIPSPEDESCQSTAFTVTFESAKATNNRFIKRHIRNLSLPVVKVYDSKVVPSSVINGNEKSKKPGNHSEGYFSSDPEDEHGNPKMSFVKHENSPTKEESSDEVDDEERSEGAPSETGTYTIDKETPDVVTARLSIDTKFGVQAPQGNKDKREWVNEWASKAQAGPSTGSLIPTKTKTNSVVSKIPSPISQRARLGSRGKKAVTPKPSERSRPNSPNISTPRDETPGDNDTERYLKTTERAMTVLAARMSLSLDSGGESDTGETRRGRPLQRSDSSASESQNSRHGGGTSTTRYNRAFSLRRGRLDDGIKKVESTPVKPLTSRVVQPPIRVKPTVLTTPQQNSLNRTDITRGSIRTPTNNIRSPLLSTPKTDFNKKKPGAGSSARSNSSLSSKEVEFQNWKRRKSYDPMKAAAEGKKKEAAARRTGVPPPAMSQSSTNATTTPKSPVNSVLRSASFHTTRQLGGPTQSSSEEDEEEGEEEETTLSAEDWTEFLPKRTTDNVPGGSRGSLYSNNSSGGSPRQRKLEGIDHFIVSAIATISNRVYTNTAIILNKLRFIFDEESEKYKELTAELELLEAGSEASSSPNKSTSRDLAITLRNLKRLDSAMKVLNDVLFENIEYE